MKKILIAVSLLLMSCTNPPKEHLYSKDYVAACVLSDICRATVDNGNFKENYNSIVSSLEDYTNGILTPADLLKYIDESECKSNHSMAAHTFLRICQFFAWHETQGGLDAPGREDVYWDVISNIDCYTDIVTMDELSNSYVWAY